MRNKKLYLSILCLHKENFPGADANPSSPTIRSGHKNPPFCIINSPSHRWTPTFHYAKRQKGRITVWYIYLHWIYLVPHRAILSLAIRIIHLIRLQKQHYQNLYINRSFYSFEMHVFGSEFMSLLVLKKYPSGYFRTPLSIDSLGGQLERKTFPRVTHSITFLRLPLPIASNLPLLYHLASLQWPVTQIGIPMTGRAAANQDVIQTGHRPRDKLRRKKERLSRGSSINLPQIDPLHTSSYHAMIRIRWSSTVRSPGRRGRDGRTCPQDNTRSPVSSDKAILF